GGGPAVDGDAAITKIADRLLQRGLDLRVAQRLGVDDHAGAKGSPDMLVDEVHGCLEESDRVAAADRGLRKNGAPRFLVENRILGEARVYVPNQTVGNLARPGGPNLPKLPSAGSELIPALGRSRVVGLTNRALAKTLGDQIKQCFPFIPAFGGHHQLGRVAVERRVVADHARDVLRLETQLVGTIRAGHDDHRGDVAQFRGDFLPQDWLAATFARLAIWPGWAPNQQIMRLVRTGDVDLVDRGMIDEVA